jgi:ABC-type sugar transport system ATPase subunit
LGIYGLQGAGRTELVETVFGLAKASEGEIYIFGEKVDVLNPNEAIKHGLAMVPEDRRRTGILTSLDVKDNIGVVKIPEAVSFGIVLSSKLVDIAEKFINKLNIKVSSVFQMAINLSGGNQQKVIISRWLAINPKILIVDEITRGIDVGAKYEIYRILQNLRKKGISILFVSSELPEILGECDRIIIMCQGEVTGEILREEATEEKVLSLAMRL